MFEDVAYIPILKARWGETQALARTPKQDRAKFLPLFEVPSRTLKFDVSEEKMTWDKHLKTIAEKLVAASTIHRPFLVDFREVDDEVRVGDSHPFDFFYSYVSQMKGSCVPAVTLRRPKIHYDAVARIVADTKKGLCIRLIPADYEDLSRTALVLDRVMEICKVDPKQVDLIVDLGFISPGSPSFVARTMLADVPHMKLYRTFGLAASAFPDPIPEVPKEPPVRPHVIRAERTEYKIWRAIREDPRSLTRVPIFCDYGVNHPAFPVRPPRSSPAPTLRYTVGEEWLVYKERKDRANAVWEIFNAVSTEQSFPGKGFSWGDGEISDAANQQTTRAQPKHLRAYAVSHHVALVLHQLANPDAA